MNILSSTLGCENVRTVVSDTGQQLVISCFSKWGSIAERTNSGGDWEMMMVEESGRWWVQCHSWQRNKGLLQVHLYPMSSHSNRKASLQHTLILGLGEPVGRAAWEGEARKHQCSCELWVPLLEQLPWQPLALTWTPSNWLLIGSHDTTGKCWYM